MQGRSGRQVPTQARSRYLRHATVGQKRPQVIKKAASRLLFRRRYFFGCSKNYIMYWGVYVNYNNTVPA